MGGGPLLLHQAPMTSSAHLVIPSDDGSAVLAVGGRVPALPVEDMFRAGELLGADLAVIRTIARLGDDRVVLCELLDVDASTVDGKAWIDPARNTDEPWISAALSAWSDGGPSDTDLLPWERDGWFREAVEWVDGVVTAGGAERIGRPRQLRHWGLSAVLSIPTDNGDIIVKQVPPGLGAEGPVTEWLAALVPGAVPAVLAVDHGGCRFAMEAVAAETPVERDDVLALAAIQGATAQQGLELEGLGVPDRRSIALIDAARQLATRDDLLFESGWSLSSTDTRRPARPVTPEDVSELLRLIDRIEPLAMQLDRSVPGGTIVHGDYHKGNVLRGDRRTVVIDWGQAAIGHPLFDLPAWPSWDDHDGQACEPFLAAWRCSIDEWTRVRPLAYLFHAVTAAHLADSMPSTHRKTDWAAAVQKLVLRSLAG